MSLAACGTRKKPAADAPPKTCNVDTMKICTQVTKTLVMTQAMQSHGRLMQNVYAPITVPESGASFTIRCQIDIGSKELLDARIIDGPQMTESTVDYFRSQGYCVVPKSAK